MTIGHNGNGDDGLVTDNGERLIGSTKGLDLVSCLESGLRRLILSDIDTADAGALVTLIDVFSPGKDISADFFKSAGDFFPIGDMDETDDGDFLGTIAVVVLGDFFDEEDDINEDTRLDLDFPDIIDTDLVNDPDAIVPEVLGLATDGYSIPKPAN